MPLCFCSINTFLQFKRSVRVRPNSKRTWWARARVNFITTVIVVVDVFVFSICALGCTRLTDGYVVGMSVCVCARLLSHNNHTAQVFTGPSILPAVVVADASGWGFAGASRLGMARLQYAMRTHARPFCTYTTHKNRSTQPGICEMHSRKIFSSSSSLAGQKRRHAPNGTALCTTMRPCESCTPALACAFYIKFVRMLCGASCKRACNLYPYAGRVGGTSYIHSTYTTYISNACIHRPNPPRRLLVRRTGSPHANSKPVYACTASTCLCYYTYKIFHFQLCAVYRACVCRHENVAYSLGRVTPLRLRQARIGLFFRFAENNNAAMPPQQRHVWVWLCVVSLCAFGRDDSFAHIKHAFKHFNYYMRTCARAKMRRARASARELALNRSGGGHVGEIGRNFC